MMTPHCPGRCNVASGHIRLRRSMGRARPYWWESTGSPASFHTVAENACNAPSGAIGPGPDSHGGLVDCRVDISVPNHCIGRRTDRSRSGQPLGLPGFAFVSRISLPDACRLQLAHGSCVQHGTSIHFDGAGDSVDVPRVNDGHGGVKDRDCHRSRLATNVSCIVVACADASAEG